MLANDFSVYQSPIDGSIGIKKGADVATLFTHLGGISKMTFRDFSKACHQANKTFKNEGKR